MSLIDIVGHVQDHMIIETGSETSFRDNFSWSNHVSKRYSVTLHPN